MIDGSVVGAYLFAGHTERIFVGQQDKGQIIVPEIFVKAVLGGQIQDGFHLFIDSRGQLCVASSF